jgi:hypothetical protein
MDGSFDGVVRQHRTIYLFFTFFVRNFPARLVRPRTAGEGSKDKDKGQAMWGDSEG